MLHAMGCMRNTKFQGIGIGRGGGGIIEIVSVIGFIPGTGSPAGGCTQGVTCPGVPECGRPGSSCPHAPECGQPVIPRVPEFGQPGSTCGQPVTGCTTCPPQIGYPWMAEDFQDGEDETTKEARSWPHSAASANQNHEYGENVTREMPEEDRVPWPFSTDSANQNHEPGVNVTREMLKQASVPWQPSTGSANQNHEPGMNVTREMLKEAGVPWPPSADPANQNRMPGVNGAHETSKKVGVPCPGHLQLTQLIKP